MSDIDEARELFLRINSSGTPLGAADRAFARAAKFDLRELATTAWEKLPSDFQGLTDEVLLQTRALLDGVHDVGVDAMTRVVETWGQRIRDDSSAIKQFTKKWATYGKRSSISDAYFCLLIRQQPLYLSNGTPMQVSDFASAAKYEHLFVNKQTGKPYTTVARVWTRLRAKAGLPHLRIHDLRHMYASFLVNSGRTLYEVQKILGHSSPSVTERYAHLSTKTLHEAANSASTIIKGAMKKAA